MSGGGTYRISENGGSFTFVGIVDNHDIRVAFAKDEIKTGTLTVEKTVQGAMGSRDAVFHFTVKLSHAQGYDSYPGGKISCRINGGAENLLALSPVSGSAGTASVSFTLTHGDTMTLYGLWDGTSYEVTEAEADQNGYETRCDAPEGTVAAEQNVSVQVINKKDLAVPTGILLPGGLPALFAGAAGVTGLLLSKRQRRR